MPHADASLWKNEQAFLEEEKKKFPEDFILDKKPRHFLLERIGILENLPSLPIGYIKYSPLDFIVEEILPDGVVITSDSKEVGPNESLVGEGTVYADLVKVGISTLDAVERVSSAISVEPSKIGYAGIKDAVAITSQRISIRGGDISTIKNASIPAVILKNIWNGKGVMNVGALKGNRFTLFIRTDESFREEVFMEQVHNISKRGVMNYFGPQRFGAPRFLSHVWGGYICRGDMDNLIESYFTEESPFEWNYVAKLRKQAKTCLGNWEEMRNIFSILPYTFRFELVLLDSLIKTNNIHTSLKSISKQVEMWVNAYSSYLANVLLSEAAMGEEIGEDIPLLVSYDKRASFIYKDLLRINGTENPIQNLRKLPFIYIAKSRSIKTRVRPVVHGVKIIKEGVAISFDLPKGAYATTVLMYLFDTTGEIPVPEWVNTNEVDTKELLGTGSMSEVKNKFGSFIEDIKKNS